MTTDNKPTRQDGSRFTDAALGALADEAERGYDVSKIVRAPGRPRMGAAPAVLVPVRLPPDLLDAVKRRAAVEQTSVSEVVRHAAIAFLATEAGSRPDTATITGTALSAAPAEAEAGFEVGKIQVETMTRKRAEVVPVRVPPEFKQVLEARAEAERTSVSEIIRAALRALLGKPDPDPSEPANIGGSRLE